MPDVIEIWKDVPGFEGRYQVSNIGNVKSITRTIPDKGGQREIKGKEIKSFFNHKGYLNCYLSKEGRTYTKMVHRLVAMAFIPNPENKPQVNHENTIKTDNFVGNLEWNTNDENMAHAVANGLFKGKKSAMLGKVGNKSPLFSTKSPNAKPIIQKTLDGLFITEWPCTMDATRELKIKKQNISANLTGNTKSAGGFKWEYKIN